MLYKHVREQNLSESNKYWKYVKLVCFIILMKT